MVLYENIVKMHCIQYVSKGKLFAFHSGGYRYNPAFSPVGIKMYGNKESALAVAKKLKDGEDSQMDFPVVECAFGAIGLNAILPKERF